jgi:hypothetical protein
MLGPNPIAQSWTSPLQTRSSETATDTFTLTWSEPRTTTGETTNGITGYFKVDDELGSGGLVIQDSQSNRASLPFNSLAEADITKTANGGPSVSQYTGPSVDSDHDPTGSSESVAYVPTGQATSYSPPRTTSMNASSSIREFQSLSDQTSVGYSSSEDTFSGALDAMSRSKPKKTGSYVTGNLGPSSHLVEYSRHFQPIQTTQNAPESDDLAFSTPNLITKSQVMDSTNTVPTTATKTTVEKLTMDNSRASRALSSHRVGLVLGSISGAALFFAIIFYLHRFCFRRMGRSCRDTGLITQQKADNAAAICPDAPEILEISRFSAYS